MIKIKYIFLLSLIFLGLGMQQLSAQGRLLRNLQQKAEEKIIEEVFGETEEKKQEEAVEQSSSESSSSDSPKNTRGGGLDADIPDVLANIGYAESSLSSKRYTEAKANVRQAIWGLELEIGRNLLSKLPKSVSGLNYLEEEDQVSSTGAGFVGLLIERVYRGKDEMEIRALVGNDSAILGLSGYMISHNMYIQDTDQPDQKRIRFQDHQAVIGYDDTDGYSLGVPFGQSSVLVITGVNFETESQFMSAANNFDINMIKKELGEQ